MSNRSDWEIMLRAHAIDAGNHRAMGARIMDRMQEEATFTDGIQLWKIASEREAVSRYEELAADTKSDAASITDAVREMMSREECVSDEDEAPPDYTDFDFDMDDDGDQE